MLSRKFHDDPFDFDDPGSIPEKDYRQMATKTLDPGAMKLPNTDRPRLSAYASGGEFTPMGMVEGTELLIQSIEKIDTKYGEAYKLGCVEEMSGEVHVICAGQMIVKAAIDAVLQEAENEGRDVQFPIPARFVKVTTKAGNQAWAIE